MHQQRLCGMCTEVQQPPHKGRRAHGWMPGARECLPRTARTASVKAPLLRALAALDRAPRPLGGWAPEVWMAALAAPLWADAVARPRRGVDPPTTICAPPSSRRLLTSGPLRLRCRMFL